MTKAKEFSRRDLFGGYNNMEVVSAQKGLAKARMEIQPQHLNGLGTVHGGALFTLADLAFAAASNCSDETVVSINSTMTFIKAETSGSLFAEAVEITRSNRLVSYEAKVTNSSGDIVAVFQGTGYIKRNEAKRE